MSPVVNFTNILWATFAQIKLVFLRFPIFTAKFEYLLHIEKKSMIIKWPSLVFENFFFSEENKFYRIGYYNTGV